MTPAFTWGAAGGRMTPDQIAAQRKVARALAEKGMDFSPVQSPWQGVARVAQALYGGLEDAQANSATAENQKADREMIASLLGGGATPASLPQSLTGSPADAIAGIESGGKYDALGPVTSTGDRAYGKYQVMGANVPAWTKAHLGQELTPEQFLANPQAQDAVFKGQFGQYAQKYGNEGAARAWFAGEGGMNNPNAKDQLGTTVAQYAQKFNNGMGAAPAAVPKTGINPLVIQAITSPYASDATKKVAGILLQQQMKQQQQANDPLRKLQIEQVKRNLQKSNEPASVQEYEYYKRNLPPDQKPMDYAAWSTAKARAGAMNVTTNVGDGENSFQKEAGKGQAERFNGLVADGQQARQLMSDMTTLADLGKNIGTGKTAQIKAALGPYADALGMKVEGLSDIQAYEAIVNRVAPSLRVKGSGSQSDVELRNFLKSIPSLGNTPDGNAIVTAVFNGLSQNKVAAAEIASKALTGEITRQEAEKQLRNLPDPMQSYREYKAGRSKIDGLLQKYGGQQ